MLTLFFRTIPIVVSKIRRKRGKLAGQSFWCFLLTVSEKFLLQLLDSLFSQIFFGSLSCLRHLSHSLTHSCMRREVFKSFYIFNAHTSSHTWNNRRTRPEWPDLAKFDGHFGKFLKNVCQFLRVQFIFGKALTQFWQIFNAMGQIFVVVNGQLVLIILAIWSHWHNTNPWTNLHFEGNVTRFG